MAMHPTKRIAILKSELSEYVNTSLADFYISPAHRWLVYTLIFILSGLAVFFALTIYDWYHELVTIELTFKGMYAWHTAANSAIWLCMVDVLIAWCVRPWGAYERRNVGKTWTVLIVAFVVAFISQRTLIYRLMGLYAPDLIWVYEMNPTQRHGSLAGFLYALPFVMIIYALVMQVMLRMQEWSEELLRVRVDTILEERARPMEHSGFIQRTATGDDDWIQLPTDPGVGPIRQSQIGHVTVEDHYLRIYYQTDGQHKETLIRMPLKELSARLPADQFARIHRSHMVNLQWVSGVKRSGREVCLNMKHGDFDLPVSRYRLPQLLPVLEKFLNPSRS